MNENNFKLNYSTPHSAQMLAILEEQEKEFNKIKKNEEFNNPINRSLKIIIEQNIKLLNQNLESNRLLEEHNKSLIEQLNIAKYNEKTSKKEAKHNRVWVYISTSIALLSLIATIVIYFI